MMPVIRISDETYARMKKHAQPFEDTPDSIIAKALAALELMGEDAPSAAAPAAKRSTAPRLPQKTFRVPLLMALLKFGGQAQAKDIRALLGQMMLQHLGEGDYESVATGDPRWWNAACWERSDMVKEGLLRDDSERGVWAVSDVAKNLAATLHKRERGTDRVIEHGTLLNMSARYWKRQLGPRPFVMVGEIVFEPIMFRRVDELELSFRSENCCKNEGLTYIGQLVSRTVDELLRIPNFGRKSVNEINEVLEHYNLRLGMQLPAGRVDAYDNEIGAT